MSDRSIGQEQTRYVGPFTFTEEPPGTRIGGHYEVRGLIGRGGMGAVYRCHDQQLGREVALKRIVTAGEGGAAGLERFRREAQAVASLNHRNIVVVHEFAEDANGPYLVMELLEGADLGAFVAAHGAMPVADVIETARQAGAALSYAHRRGVIHRDIKPTNLFRLKDRTIKMLDFGLARVGTDSQLSMEGFGLGTLDYVSPEQRRDATRVDHRSDLFSLGATLYYLATGRAPRLVRERDIPDELRAVVLSLMEDRPEDRPFSVEEALAPLSTEASVRPSSGTLKRAIEGGTCPACGALNPDDARFCFDCGAGLFETCPSCKTEARAGRKYCAKCGSATAAPRMPAAGVPREVAPPTPPPVATPAAIEAGARASNLASAASAPIEPAEATFEPLSALSGSPAIPVAVRDVPMRAPAVAFDTIPAKAPVADVVEAPDGRRVLGKIRRRLIPFAFLLYAASYIAQGNVGFAAPQLMEKMFGLATAVFHNGAVLFTIGLCLFALPSTLLMNRVGARLWIASIMIACGLVSAAMMFMTGPAGFDIVRFLLGVAVAGFVPGMLVYLSSWFPRGDRARPIALFLSGGVAAAVIVGPLSRALIAMSGWQFVFLAGGLPAIALGVVTLFYLPNGPQDANWLTDQERRWLQDRLRADRGADPARREPSAWQAFSTWHVWVLCAIYFIIVLGQVSIGAMLPRLFGPGLVIVVPYLVGIVGMIWIGSHSDRRAERRWHVAGPAVLAAVGCLLSTGAQGPWLALPSISLAALGVWGALSPFWALSSAVLTGSAAAVAIGFIYSIGSAAGIFASELLYRFGSSGSSITLVPSFLVMAAIVAVIRERQPSS